MKRVLWVLILLAMAAAPTAQAETTAEEQAIFEQLEQDRHEADEAEWAQQDAENAGLEQLATETVSNPFQD